MKLLGPQDPTCKRDQTREQWLGDVPGRSNPNGLSHLAKGTCSAKAGVMYLTLYAHGSVQKYGGV